MAILCPGHQALCKPNLPLRTARQKLALHTCPASIQASLPIEPAHCNAALGRPDVRFAVGFRQYQHRRADGQ